MTTLICEKAGYLRDLQLPIRGLGRGGGSRGLGRYDVHNTACVARVSTGCASAGHKTAARWRNEGILRHLTAGLWNETNEPKKGLDSLDKWVRRWKSKANRPRSLLTADVKIQNKSKQERQDGSIKQRFISLLSSDLCRRQKPLCDKTAGFILPTNQ